MADVQKRKGYTQIANRLIEAMIEARFNEQQSRIVLALLRLTYGWNAKSVRMREYELAQRCGNLGANATRAGGAFRVAMAALIKNDVVVRLETAKRGVFIWGLNKDYETWSAHAAPVSKLAAVWSTRPPISREDDNAISNEVARIRAGNGRTSRFEEPAHFDNDGTESGPDQRTGIGPDGPENEWPGYGPESGPATGQSSGPKSLSGETYERLKTVKDSSTPLVSTDHQTVASIFSGEKAAATAAADAISENETAAPRSPSADSTSDGGDEHAPTPESTTGSRARTAEESERIRQYAIGMSTAVNNGIAYRWGEQPNPIGYVTGLPAAEFLIGLGVPLELARMAIVSWCHASKKAEPPKTLAYFRDVVQDAYRAAEQRAFNAADPGPASRPASAPTQITAVVHSTREQQRARDEYEDQSVYDAERRAAAIAWGKDQANKAAYASIAGEVSGRYAEVAESPWRQRAMATEIIAACAERAGFPTFEAWRAARAAVGAA